MERELFTDFPKILPDVPVKDTKFWEWLKTNEIDSFIPAISEYLNEHGFVISNHIITEDQVKYHRMVFSHFWWCKLHNLLEN